MVLHCNICLNCSTAISFSSIRLDFFDFLFLLLKFLSSICEHGVSFAENLCVCVRACMCVCVCVCVCVFPFSFILGLHQFRIRAALTSLISLHLRHNLTIVLPVCRIHSRKLWVQSAPAEHDSNLDLRVETFKRKIGALPAAQLCSQWALHSGE